MGHGVLALVLFGRCWNTGLRGCGPQVAGELDVAATNFRLPTPGWTRGALVPFPQSPEWTLPWRDAAVRNQMEIINYDHRAGVVLSWLMCRTASLIARQIDKFHCLLHLEKYCITPIIFIGAFIIINYRHSVVYRRELSGVII